MSHLVPAVDVPSPASRPLRVAVVEPANGAGAFRALLGRSLDVVVVAAGDTLDHAVERIHHAAPDALLLDLACGIHPILLLERAHLRPEETPLVVAGDAPDAILAFQARAVDFLLKPIDENRVRHSLARVRSELRNVRDATVARRMLGLLHGLHDPTPRVVPLKTGGRLVLVDVGEIDYIEAEGNYTIVHIGEMRQIVRKPISRFERELGPSFVRVHRSALVNVRRITEVRRLPNGGQDVLLAGGGRVTVSRRLRLALAARVGSMS